MARIEAMDIMRLILIPEAKFLKQDKKSDWCGCGRLCY